MKVLNYIGHGPKMITKAKEHIKYMEANREHHRNNPHLFESEKDHVPRQSFFRRLEKQKISPRHAFMHKMVITLSEQERNELQIDLKELARDTMARFGAKVNCRLDWVGAVHDDQGHPHVHIAIRGRDLDGKPIFIGKQQIRDLREIADQEKVRQAERNLGPEQAEKTMERLNQHVIRESRGNEPNFGEILFKGLTVEFEKMIRKADQERKKSRNRRERETKRNRGR